jgi:hypothetical protein
MPALAWQNWQSTREEHCDPVQKKTTPGVHNIQDQSIVHQIATVLLQPGWKTSWGSPGVIDHIIEHPSHRGMKVGSFSIRWLDNA